jgi:DNA-binding SARP family transcriptional activator
MEFRILGPLEVVADGKALDLGGPKQRALLAILLLEANRVVSSDRLIEALWQETPPETAQKALQVYVSKLRRLLGKERLETKAPGYRLRVGAHELDLARFQRLRQEGKLREALSLWRGPPLAELAYERFAQREIERLEELRLVTLEERIERDLARGRHAELVGELEALAREHPLRERLRGQLMLALYRSGRQAEALGAYQAARRTLVDELGIEPDRALRDLHQAVLKQDPSLDFVSTSEKADETAEAARDAFVGRKTELHELLTALDDALAGRGRLFLIAGEPGIGKSRLADELIRHARQRGARVLVGRCWEAGGAPAYWPWMQSLRTYIREVEPEALHAQLGAGAIELAQILPELREILPGLPEPASREAEGARFRLFDAVAEFLRNASQSRPIVLVLDDLHAADASSLLLLQFVTRELSSTRMLLLGAYRDIDPIPGQPLTNMVAEVAREPVTRRLPLGGLGEREVAAYVDLTASQIGSAELATALHEETEGNPLFVSEIVRLLSVEGLRSRSTAEARLGIPQTVRDVIARRLTHLSEECNRVLVLASVLGREFALAALARVGHVSEDELLDVLDEAIGARVVSEVPGAPGRLRFAHVLIRETLYEGLSSARRIRMHRLTAETLAALYGDEPGPHFAELAHHSIAGHDFDQGLHYARRAGDWALDVLAYEEAMRLYESALEALELTGRSDERTRCELLLSRGTAAVRAGNTPAADEALADAASIARRLGLSRELARAAADYGGRMVWARGSQAPRLVPLLEEGLAGLGEEDVELRARLLARLAGALRDERSRDRRDALSAKAVELARRTGNPAALVDALDGRAMAILAPDTLAECIAVASELREVAERIGDRERVVDGYMQRVAAQVVVGDVAAIEADLGAASPVAQELGQPAHIWDVCAARAMLALAAGKFGEGEELVERALALGERAVPGAIPVYRLQRYTLCDFRGGLEQIESAICDLVAEHPARPVFRCVLAHLHGRLGRLPEAKRTLVDLAEDDFSDLPFDQEWLYAMSLLAEAAALVRDSDSASVLYGLLLPWAALNAADMSEGIRGSVSRYLGLVATTTKRWEEAKLHLEDALAMNASMGARPWLALTQEDYARMLLARDDPGDRERAHELLDAALATYCELGMETHAASASALAEEVGAAAGRSR